NVSSYMGAILLIGLDMKNGIILVEYIQQLRSQGMELRAALLQAGRTRFRPILMTSLAAILGLLPLGFVIGTGAHMQSPLVLKGKPGKLDHLALDAKRERLFVANKVNNTLDVVDLKAGKLLQQLPNQFGVQGIAYAADLDRVYSALGTGGFCNVFDGNDYKL